MSALAADRDTPELASSFSMTYANVVAADSTQFYKGGIVCLDSADGKVKKGATSATLVCLGRSEENYLTGTSNTKKIKVKSGIFKFLNSASADLIADDDVGKTCYIVDDQTVALTSNSAARSAAGTVHSVDSDGGVFVAMKFPLS